MKAIYLDKIKMFSERDVELPKYGEHDVVVRMKAVGVCGSDIHYWMNGRIGNFIVKEPLLLGHECAAVVAEVGEKVSRVKVGDRVVLEPGIPCMECEHCKKGRYNLCQNIVFFATPPDDGVLVEKLVYNENYVFKIPDAIDDFALATMAEPMSVGVFAANRIKPSIEDNVVIFGAGIIGIMCLIVCKERGCKRITVVDIRNDRLECAKKMGADEVINSMENNVMNNEYDVAFEASGAEKCYQIAAKCIKPGGRIAMIGMGKEMQDIPVVEYVCKEISMIPSFRYCNTYPFAVDMVCKYKDKLKELITHRVPFNMGGVEEAFKIASEDSTAVKVVIEF